MGENSGDYTIRNAIDILSDGSIVCQGEVPVGSEIHLMISSRASAKQAALEATRMALNRLKGQTPKLVFILESITRLKLLGRSAFGEIKQIKEILPPQTPIFGMYGHGEITSYSETGQTLNTNLQNESIVVLAIS